MARTELLLAQKQAQESCLQERYFVEQENAEFIAVYAPGLHGALIPANAPATVLCFDPGLPLSQEQSAANRGRFHPSNLPLSEKEAQAWLRSMLTWGMQFDSPGQLAAMAAAEALHKRSHIGGMPPDEVADLQRFSSGLAADIAKDTAEASPEQKQKALLLQAQLHLLLAWSLEERKLELSSLGHGLASQYERFGQALGLEEDQEATEAGMVRPLTLEEGDDLTPRLEVAAAMLPFLPAGSCIYTEDSHLATAWLEQGIAFSGLEEGCSQELAQAFSGCEDVQLARTPGWRLAGKRGAVPELPWLDHEYLAAFRARK